MNALKALADQTGHSVSHAATTVSRISFSWNYAAIGACLAVIAAALVYYVTVYSRTRPLGGDNFVGTGPESVYGEKPTRKASGYNPNANKRREGFYGGAAEGTGQPFCSQQSVEGARLYAMFDGRSLGPADTVNHDDFREFTQLLGKLSCLKKDLMSPSGIVSDTKLLDYETASDLEPVQETAARCLAQTIPQRDLDLAFDKWNKRGSELLLHLCTGANLNETEVRNAEQLWAALWKDVYDIANTQCIGRPGSIIAGQEQPRDPKPYSPLALMDDAPYKGFSTGLFQLLLLWHL